MFFFFPQRDKLLSLSWLEEAADADEKTTEKNIIDSLSKYRNVLAASQP